MYKSTIVDDEVDGGSDYTASNYAQITEAVTEKTTDVTLTVWPNLRGEKAHYRFEFYPTADIETSNEIWVQFDADYYDYFVTDVLPMC